MRKCYRKTTNKNYVTLSLKDRDGYTIYSINVITYGSISIAWKLVMLPVMSYSGSAERQSSKSRVTFQESHPHLLLNKPAQTRTLSMQSKYLKVIHVCLC